MSTGQDHMMSTLDVTNVPHADTSVASCPVCSRTFRPRTLSSAWSSVSRHLEERRRQGCEAHTQVHVALHAHGGPRGGFGCAGCPLLFREQYEAFAHVAAAHDPAHRVLHVPDVNFAPPHIVAASAAAARRPSRRLTNRLNAQLYEACNQGNRETVARLLALGMDPNYSAGTDSITPLMTAAEHGFDEILGDLLATRRCDANRTNVYGQTALVFAAQNDRLACVRLLVAAPGIDLELRSSGLTAAQLARRAGNVDAADVLAHAMRDGQLVAMEYELLRGCASGMFDSFGERMAALYEAVTGLSPGGFVVGREEPDVEPEGFYSTPLCIVCMENDVDTALIPCFHASYCEPCALAVWENGDSCAVCRKSVSAMQKIYF